MKFDKRLAIPVVVIFSLLLIFIIFYNRTIHESNKANLDNHCRVIASAMWIYESEGVMEYLKLACRANNYQYLKVLHNNGEKFIDISITDQSLPDRLLTSANLITTEEISSTIAYKDVIVGKIIVAWHNKSVYIYSYLTLIAFLLATTLCFYLRIQKAKQNLEVRVKERTHDLQEEIAERKQAEEALKQSQNDYRILIENLPQKIFLKDTNSSYLTCNENFAMDFNTAPHDIAGKSDFDFFPIELAEKYRLDDSRIIKNKNMEEIEEKYVAGGKEHVVQTVKTAVLDKDGKVTGLLGIFWDITEQKHIENQLRQAQKMESIGTLAGGIAHDFNNILGIIIGNAELAMDHIPESNPGRENMEELTTASLRAKDVVRQLLSFARQTQIEKKPTHITPVVEESLSLLRSSIPKNIEIRKDLSNDIYPIISDPIQINQILINLCTNAYHAMPEGGIITVTLSNLEFEDGNNDRYPGLNPGQYIYLAVSDTGEGIPEKYMNRIFDPYFSTKKIDKGTGMGLAVVHGIVKEHGGTIHVKSKPETGTIFNIFFPGYKGEMLTKAEPHKDIPTGKERILFVDDEASLVKAAQRTLEGLGYQVDSTTCPVEALEKFSKRPEKYDLVITDMAMPQITGDKLISEILNIRSDIKIMLCTGFSESINEAAAKDLGAYDYLEKPINKNELAIRIRKVLNAHKLN